MNGMNGAARIGVSERADFVTEKLALARGVLVLLRETRLFDPMVERAIRDLDEVVETFGQEPFYGRSSTAAEV